MPSSAIIVVFSISATHAVICSRDQSRVSCLDFHFVIMATCEIIENGLRLFCAMQVLREQYGVRCMLGLTATATMTTAVSVARHLGIVNDSAATIRGAPIPENLKLSVSSDGNREQVNARSDHLKYNMFAIFYFKLVIDRCHLNYLQSAS